MKRIVTALTGCAGLLLAGQTLLSTPSNAAPNGCTAQMAVCLYADDDYLGGGIFHKGANTKGNLTGWNDEADSYYNNSSLDSMWYDDTYQGGDKHCMNSYSHNHSFSWSDSDEASSWRIFGNATSC